MNFTLIFDQYLAYLLPLKLRGAKMMAWTGVLVSPVQTINGVFAAWVSDTRYFMQFNGQVVYLEHRLNDEFDSTDRRIYIDDPSGGDVVPLYVYRKPEQQNDLLIYNKAGLAAPLYLLNRTIGGSDDFIVYLPSSIHSASIERTMRRVIDQYRIAGVQYSFILV